MRKLAAAPAAVTVLRMRARGGPDDAANARCAVDGRRGTRVLRVRAPARVEDERFAMQDPPRTSIASGLHT